MFSPWRAQADWVLANDQDRDPRRLGGTQRAIEEGPGSVLAFVQIADILADVCAEPSSSNRTCLHSVDVVLAGTNPAVPVRHAASESNTDEVCAEFVVRSSRVTAAIEVAFQSWPPGNRRGCPKRPTADDGFGSQDSRSADRGSASPGHSRRFHVDEMTPDKLSISSWIVAARRAWSRPRLQSLLLPGNWSACQRCRHCL